MSDVVASMGQSMSHPRKFRKQSEEVFISWVQTNIVRALEQIKRAGTKTVDKHYTEGKAKCTCFQASMFNTDHQITTFCVLIQPITVEW